MLDTVLAPNLASAPSQGAADDHTSRVCSPMLGALQPLGTEHDPAWPEENVVAFRHGPPWGPYDNQRAYTFIRRRPDGELYTEHTLVWRGLTTPSQGWFCVRTPVSKGCECTKGLYRYDQARFDAQDRVMAHRYANFGKKGLPLEPPPGTPRWSEVVWAALNRWRDPPPE